jgi:hypothetical protein
VIFLKLAYLYFGYLLIYAAVANHGRFATSPWAGVYGDAYAQGGGVKAKQGGGNEDISFT